MLKAVALYRDGSKLSQPLNTTTDDTRRALVDAGRQSPWPSASPTLVQPLPGSRRRCQPARRLHAEGQRRRPQIYLRTGEVRGRHPREIFLDMHKEGARSAA